MSRRDTQKSRVYAWERATFAGVQHKIDERFRAIEDAAAFLHPVWRSERGRYGAPKREAPAIMSSHRGQRAALAYGSRKITLPLWARNPIVMLHELAHCLDHANGSGRGGGHGPRFVGIFIGLLCRHYGQDADDLMAAADEHGVRYDVRSIGAVPVRGRTLPERLAALLPVNYMAAAVELDVGYRAVYGAALSLIRHGRARWAGKRLVPA